MIYKGKEIGILLRGNSVGRRKRLLNWRDFGPICVETAKPQVT